MEEIEEFFFSFFLSTTIDIVTFNSSGERYRYLTGINLAL